jgi:hypothetical protein
MIRLVYLFSNIGAASVSGMTANTFAPISLHTVMRLLAILGVVALYHSPIGFLSTVYILTIAHYGIAIVYSKRQLSGACSSLMRAIPLLITVAASLFVPQLGVYLLYYFGVHHVFTEVYLLQREVHAGSRVETKWLRFWAILFNLSLYLAILHRSPKSLPIEFCLGAVAVTGVFYFATLYMLRNRFSLRQVLDTSAIELLSFAVLALSFNIKVTIMSYVAYHILFWAIYPIPKLIKSGKLFEYLGWNVLFTGASWFFSPLGLMPTNPQAWHQFFINTSVLHISSSFALSSTQPGWLNKLFRVQVSPALSPPAGAVVPNQLVSAAAR